MYGHYGPEGSGVAEIFGYHPAEDDAETHTQIPAGQQGGVGGAALVVMRHRNDHVLEGWPHMPVAQTNEYGSGVKADGMPRNDEHRISDGGDDDSDARMACQLAFSQ